MKGVLVVVAVASLQGCAGGLFGPDLAKMTADQIKETSRIKDANVACVEVGTPWGKQRSVVVSVDKSVVVNGSLTVDGECKATFQNAPAPLKTTP